MRVLRGWLLMAVVWAGAAHAGEPLDGQAGMDAGAFANRFAAVAELGLSLGHYSNPGSNGDSATVAGLGSASVPLGDTAALQVDLENTFSKYDGNRVWRDVTGTVHLFTRDPARGAFGVVAGISHVYPDSSFTGVYDAGAVGIEGLAYFGRVTATGQLAYGHFDFVGNPTDSVIANAGLRYYPSDNTMVAGKLGVVGNNTKVGNDWTLFQGQARFEHRISGTPVSIGANYLYTSWDSDRWEQVFGLFGRVYFGGESLFQDDRTGRSMDALTNPLVWN